LQQSYGNKLNHNTIQEYRKTIFKDTIIFLQKNIRFILQIKKTALSLHRF